MTKEKIARINELAHKSKTPEGRRGGKGRTAGAAPGVSGYFRASFTAQLENTSIQSPDGTIHKVTRRTGPKPPRS